MRVTKIAMQCGNKFHNPKAKLFSFVFLPVSSLNGVEGRFTHLAKLFTAEAHILSRRVRSLKIWTRDALPVQLAERTYISLNNYTH